MIKKLICALCLFCLVTPCMANIHLKGKTVGAIIEKYIPRENWYSAKAEYERLVKEAKGAGLSAKSLWSVCDWAGLNVENWAGKQQCENFVRALVQASYSKYYEVCGTDKGKSKGTELCIEVFDDVQVQLAQAQSLAEEYAKVKYDDDVRCSKAIRESGNDHYIKCTSYDKTRFYEFRFDDAKESNYLQNAFVRKEFGRGLCIIYGGKPNLVGSASKIDLVQLDMLPGVNLKDLVSGCTISKCDTLGTKVKKWGYVTSKQYDICFIGYKGIDDIPVHKNYFAKFNGKTFDVYYGTDKIKSWSAVSGRGNTPHDSRPTVCQTPKYQVCNHVGPIPAGTYYVSKHEIEYADNIEVGDFEHNDPTYNRRNAPENRTGWGAFRVLLNPDKSTNTYGRGGMYIHGGKWRGSAGCIDLTSNIGDFVDWFVQQTDFVKLKVVVDYGSVSGLCCTGKSCSGGCTCPADTEEDIKRTCKYL